MNKVALLLICFLPAMAFSQPKQVSQAIVYTTTNVIAPEEEDIAAQGFQDQGGRMNFRNFGDGETKSTTYLKNTRTKTVLKSEMGRSVIFRDNDAKLTTTLVEVMGNKMGFYATDADMAEQARQMDSIRQARRKADSTRANVSMGSPADFPTEIVPAEGTKKIAGYQCNKAWLVTTRLLGIRDSVVFWYTPEFKLAGINFTGGMSGFGSFGNNMLNSSTRGFDKVDGFVMGYEMPMRRNRRMEVYVTKIELDKEIADKEFDIPKDIELKSIKEMQSSFGGPGGMQFRRMQ